MDNPFDLPADRLSWSLDTHFKAVIVLKAEDMISSLNKQPIARRFPVNESKPPTDSPPPPGQIDPPRVVPSAELFAGARVVVIEHAGQRYRLLITRNDRLILQK